MVPLSLSFSAPLQEVLGALDCCVEILGVFCPGVHLCETHDRPGLATTPCRIVFVALIRHFRLRMTGAWVKVDEMIRGEVWTKDLVYDGVGVLSCDFN